MFVLKRDKSVRECDTGKSRCAGVKVRDKECVGEGD